MAYGSVLSEQVDSHEARKSRGAFFTPPIMARFLCESLVKETRDCVLEPACGEGIFIEEAAHRLRAMGASEDEVNNQLFGCELHPETAAAARQRLSELGISPRIAEGDFFEMEPTQDMDVVVGNPPYIRYQSFVGESRALARRRALQQGVALNSLSSSWAPFVVHATGFLKHQGSLGMVLPAELFSANYAAPVRAHLLASFSTVTVHIFEHAVFPEVEEEVVLLLAEGYGAGPSKGVCMVQHLSLGDLHTAGGVYCALEASDRWPLGRHGSEGLTVLRGLDFLRPLSEWGTIRLGAVTGANDYFCLTRNDMEALGLDADEALPLCPTGSRHLRALSYDQRDFERAVSRATRTWLFYPGDNPSNAARRYIRQGAERGIDMRYKCRTRTPWWRVPGVSTCDLFVTCMNGIGPNLCQNQLELVYLNSVHGLTLRPELRPTGRACLPVLFLSTLSQLSAEVQGRSYGGGMLKLEPREAARTLVPSAEATECLRGLITDAYREEIDHLLRTGKRDSAMKRVDALLIQEGLLEEDCLLAAKECLEALRLRRAGRSSNKEVA